MFDFIHAIDLHTPAMTVAIALAVGMAAQSLAYHLRLPGIVILLLAGVALGPDGLNIIHPWVLGKSLYIIIGFAIAVILFEGGMNIDWVRLRRQAPTIRRLVTIGALITWIGSALVARFVMQWDWRLSILFGSLVIVTGPTVVGPLLRRIRVNRNLQTILEAEGVFIDAIGAVLAVVAFEVALQFSGANVAAGVLHVSSRLAIGVVVGLIGGSFAVLMLRWRRVIPAGMEKVFTLTVAWVTFQASNMLQPESGIMAAIVAGLVVGNVWTGSMQDVKEFKEQLTVMLIGMLFVLLAATVGLSEVTALGMRGLVAVAAIALIVRPVEVFICTFRSGLNWREKTFLSWIAPRGIVAAAIATLFHTRMQELGIPGGDEMRGLVFLVITGTVLVQGLTGSLLASVLKVRRPRGQGFVILGANDLAISLGEILRTGGDEVILIDANPELCSAAEKRGFRVLHGNALDDRILQQADLDTRKAVVALLPNGGVNLLFAESSLDEHRVPRAYVAMHRGAITASRVEESHARVLFGSEVDVDLWASRLRRDSASVDAWRFLGTSSEEAPETFPVPRDARNLVLPAVVLRGEARFLVDEKYEPRKNDVVRWVTFGRRNTDVQSWLEARGWEREDDDEASA
ncbi:MAG: cation:proton antiporter [Candidatus Krumholzibacteria bacterium]|nr:cation:proton antiporter [Candidatus Krumholzibacteria bacterium]MDH4336835.1 cation:proton antiporter [Candidatus Krumholzibacteria bacterium]MDH5269166.1 cation:proton antiporter [Candidatus Krumholzibacteria bacterium]MDH5628198.1 cation:proton antiporter [Candidatus Krumholzibacteria bacterium]